MIKKLLFVLVFIVSINSKAQTGVTNLSFENWSNTIFGYEPNGWFGITISQQTVGAQQGTSYARIMTTSTVSSGFNGVMSLATISSSNIVNGAAYNQKPVSISGFYKTSGLGVNDTAAVYSFMMNAGNIVAFSSIFYITGNNSSWTSFTIPYTYYSSLNPDTINIVGLSNKQGLGSSSGNVIGSTLDLDNLSLQLITGIDAMSVGTSFMVYPNPAVNELNVVSKDITATTIIITDLDGRIVDEISIENEKTRLNLEEYSSGHYVYSIQNKDGTKLLTNKFVIKK